MLQCTKGLAPAVFTADPLPGAPKIFGSLPAATVAQVLPKNIPPFVLCNSILNPAVAAATSANMGALTPAACNPKPVGPWAPPSAVTKINMIPLATVASKCLCAFGGQISVAAPIPGPADSL